MTKENCNNCADVTCLLWRNQRYYCCVNWTPEPIPFDGSPTIPPANDHADEIEQAHAMDRGTM